MIVGLILSTLVEMNWLSLRLAAWLLGLWVFSELALYPLLKIAYAPKKSQAGGLESLIGRHGTARDALAPEGYVLMGAERWRARKARRLA